MATNKLLCISMVDCPYVAQGMLPSEDDGPGLVFVIKVRVFL